MKPSTESVSCFREHTALPVSDSHHKRGRRGRAFTIPTSLLSGLLGVSPIAFVSAALGYLASAINAAYLINVGVDYDALATTQKRLLVHETTHVWQGKNSKFALSYVFASLVSQAVHQPQPLCSMIQPSPKPVRPLATYCTPSRRPAALAAALRPPKSIGA